MAAADQNLRVRAQSLGQARPGRVRRIEADHHQPDPAAIPLDQRIGRQRRRQRDQRHLLGRDAALRHRRVDRAADAAGQIVARGQTLGLGDQRRRSLTDPRLAQDRRVGVGAARIDAQKHAFGGCGRSAHCIGLLGRVVPGSLADRRRDATTRLRPLSVPRPKPFQPETVLL